MTHRLVAPTSGAIAADAARRIRHVFVRDLELGAKIGVHTFERTTTQPVRINVDLAVDEAAYRTTVELAVVVCYEDIVDAI